MINSIEDFEKYISEKCNYPIKIIETENFGIYNFKFSFFGTVSVKYKIDYSKSKEENLSNLKYKLLYTIFKE